MIFDLKGIIGSPKEMNYAFVCAIAMGRCPKNVDILHLL